MYNPRKINLYLENELPVKNDNQTGGVINYNLINNKKNKYLRAERKIETHIYGAPKIEEDVELWFEFENEIMNNDANNNDLYYMERSNNSISFAIQQKRKYSNVIVKNMPSNNLILKLQEFTHKNMESFIEEWKENKKTLKDNIPDIYMYGKLFTTDKIFICDYYITKKYKNYIDLLKIEYEHTIKYIINMLMFIENCREQNLILRNLKFSGIGYEFVNSEIKFVLLDYNDISLIKISDDFFKKFTDGCDAMCAGTLVPYFIIHDFFEMNSNWLNKLDKLYVVGLAEIIIFLIYEQNDLMENLFKILYNPSYLKPCLHYFHYMKLFDDKNKIQEFRQLLNSLTPKFIEIEQRNINPMFMRIVYNCFEMTYETVNTPLSYLGHMKEIYDEVAKERNSIKTHIQPIESGVEEINATKKKDTIKKEDDDEKTDIFVKNKTLTKKKYLDKDTITQNADYDIVTEDLNTHDDELLIEDEVIERDAQGEENIDSFEEKTMDDLTELLENDDMIDFKEIDDKPKPKSILKHPDTTNILYKKVSFEE
jgi:hypothetical protein